MNNNNELTKTEKAIISFVAVTGLSALYAVFACVIIFVFSALFGVPNMMIAQFIPMFVLSLLSINDIIKFTPDNDKED